MTRYRVKYYDAKLSRKGQGTQAKYFDSYEAAAAWADGMVLYARPARVESVTETDGCAVYRLVTGPDDPGTPSPMK